MRYTLKRAPLISLYIKKIFLLILVLGAQKAFCESQEKDQKRDSLESLLSCQPVEKKIDILYELAYHYGNTDYWKAFSYGDQALEIARKIGDSLRIVRAGRIKSSIYRRLNEIDSSLILSSEILPIARRNKYTIELKSILNGLAHASISKASYDNA